MVYMVSINFVLMLTVTDNIVDNNYAYIRRTVSWVCGYVTIVADVTLS